MIWILCVLMIRICPLASMLMLLYVVPALSGNYNLTYHLLSLALGSPH